MKRRMPWEPKKEPVKGPREVKEKENRTLRPRITQSRGIPKTGAWTRRTRRDHKRFVAAVHERDEYCRGGQFLNWLAINHMDVYEKTLGCQAWFDQTLDVHHIWQKSTDRKLAFMPENGLLVRRWIHCLIHDYGLEKMVQEWWLSIHPEYREVLGK